MDSVQLILIRYKDNYFYGELVNGVIYCGHNRGMYIEDLTQHATPEEWQSYASYRSFDIVLNGTKIAAFNVEHVPNVAKTKKEGYIIPLFQGTMTYVYTDSTLENCMTAFPILLRRSAKPVQQPPVVGQAPKVVPPTKTLEEHRQDVREYEASQTPAERSSDKAYRDSWVQACGIGATPKKTKMWF